MAEPFNDPDVQRLMRNAGVVHKPGLAAELIQEIGPLLAEDGFDINNLETDDLDTLNLALGRAIERRNFERFVPVGQTRAMALTALRLMAEAISEKETALAEALMLGRDADRSQPSDQREVYGEADGDPAALAVSRRTDIQLPVPWPILNLSHRERIAKTKKLWGTHQIILPALVCGIIEADCARNDRSVASARRVRDGRSLGSDC
jgi:hypothetical protein